ncbi:magnesium transporter NIPA-domain-containing protein [Mycena olivaceomarginata]|nr:magnesium transporter NIPA-domain-containing protein [Mycena olivaceomarginata]
MLETKYIGLAMANVITKMGLTASADGTSATENMSLLRNSMWWAGTAHVMFVGEVANFGAYTFAPPIMVTQLGVLAAIFASFLLNEQTRPTSDASDAQCAFSDHQLIVLHAPGDQDLENSNRISEYAVEPGFLLYCFTVCVFSLFMAYGVAPKHGRTNPLFIYRSHPYSRFAGHNQFIYPSTYLFGLISVVCIVIQLNYANKALDLFSVNLINPIYYVGFCTATVVASLILFKGLNTTSVTDTLSLLTGFVVTFLGVHILNLAMLDPDSLADSLAVPDSAPALPLDHGSPWTQDPRVPGHTTGHTRRASLTGLRTPLFGAFPREGGIGLGTGDVRLELLEEDEEENEFRPGAQLFPSARSTRTSIRPPNIRISPRPV